MSMWESGDRSWRWWEWGKGGTGRGVGDADGAGHAEAGNREGHWQEVPWAVALPCGVK